MRLLLLAALAALVFAVGAGAHNRDTWYWNHYNAQVHLRDDGIEYSDGTYAEVATVRCFGRGNTLASSDPKKPAPLYRHFRCYGTATDGGRINVLLHVTGKNLYVLTS